MKKIFLLLIVYLLSNTLFAQNDFSIVKISKLNIIDKGYRPVFLTKKQIIYTGNQEKGIYLYDLRKKKRKKLNEDPGAGHHFIISEDRKKIAYKTYFFDKQGRRQTSVYEQDIKSGTKNLLLKNARNLSSLSYRNNNLSFTQAGNLKVYSKGIKNSETDQQQVFTDENLNLVLYQSGAQKILNPLGTGNYIWVSLSPDGNKILFNKTGKGTYICDLQGNIIADLGRIHAAKWSDDGKWIIGMDDYDDGQKYTRSKIILISSDGKTKNVIELKDIPIALYPDISKNNSKIVFNNDRGEIYLIKIRLH